MLLGLTDRELEVIEEQCQDCKWWDDDAGCEFEGARSNHPYDGCLVKQH